jgi:hypothetical protein
MLPKLSKALLFEVFMRDCGYAFVFDLYFDLENVQTVGNYFLINGQKV